MKATQMRKSTIGNPISNICKTFTGDWKHSESNPTLNLVTEHCSNNTKTNLGRRGEVRFTEKCVGPLFHKNAVSFFNACMSWIRKELSLLLPLFEQLFRAFELNQAFFKHPTQTLFETKTTKGITRGAPHLPCL